MGSPYSAPVLFSQPATLERERGRSWGRQGPEPPGPAAGPSPPQAGFFGVGRSLPRVFVAASATSLPPEMVLRGVLTTFNPKREGSGQGLACKRIGSSREGALAGV